MGCNMCVVEKTEEQFKGSNGLRHGVTGHRSPHSSPPSALRQELCKASPEQTVEMLRAPRDPLVIQVLRRSPRCKGQASGHELQLVDNGTQTEISFEHIMALGKEHAPSPPVIQLEPYPLTELPPLGSGFYDPNDYLDSGHHEVDRTEELEYEEVELYKRSHTEKLGLTVCYRTDDEADTGIYIGEINPNGIAAKDGRIKAGDRIVQINGVEVQNREEAVAILTREDSTNISLLLARPELELDEGWMEEPNEAANVSSREEGSEGTPCLGKGSPVQQGGAETGHVLSNSQELDSGVGRTDDSTRNDESSEHDLLADEPPPPAPGATTPPSLTRRHPRPSADAPALDESLPGLTQAESRRYRELVELRRRLEAGARHAPSGGRRCQGSLAPALREEMGHLEFKSRSGARAQKMRQLRARCMAAWLAGEGRPLEGEPPSPPTPPGAGEPPPRGLCDITELPERAEPTTPTTTTTSAYNTGESCRSTPPLGERPPPGVGTASPPTSRSLPRQGAPGQRRPEGQRARRAPAGSPHYFTKLEQPAARPEAPSPPVAGHAEGPRGDWKGRGRAEGARPPAKRPVRDRLLKARALKIREERAGMTTDDDAASEMKMGRYWSKGERKQHLARAREHRRRRELMMQSRLDWLRGSAGEHQGGEGAPRPGAGGGAELSVVALGHRKSLRKRSRRILDNWITIQEMLAYGTRAPDGRRVYNPLLSVTTV